MPENTIVTQNFTYKVPNSKFSSSDSDGNEVTASYTGPDKGWVFVDLDGDKKGKLNRSPGIKYEADEGDDIPIPSGTRKVEVTVADDPLILALLVGQSSVTISGQSQITEDLPDGTQWTENSKLEILEAYDIATLEYDIDAESWSVGYQAASTSWDTVIAVRNQMLVATDSKISPDMPDSVKAPWVAVRTKLRDLPATFKKGESDEIDPWKVNYPQLPDTVSE